ncbi:MAG: hypothetical protein AB1540_00705 [Bdellovibrionota bacterium]
MLNLIFSLVFILSAIHGDSNAKPKSIAESFPPGSGSKFLLSMADGTSANLIISIASSSSSRVAVEYYFSSTDAPIELWQQFIIEGAGTARLRVAEGYIYAKELKHPERIPKDHLTGIDETEINEFLFSTSIQSAEFRVGEDVVQVPAGQVSAKRFKKQREGATLEYWISEQASPLGLVKLVSKGPKPEQNYTIVLGSLVKNVKPKIDPSAAEPLSATGRGFLAPLKKR